MAARNTKRVAWIIHERNMVSPWSIISYLIQITIVLSNPWTNIKKSLSHLLTAIINKQKEAKPNGYLLGNFNLIG
jgi:hypothetical protein